VRVRRNFQVALVRTVVRARRPLLPGAARVASCTDERRSIMRHRLVLASLPLLAGCTFPQTKMEPAEDYAASHRVTVSAAPAFTAGPTEVRTTSPDGATTFVCADGSHVSATKVPPGSSPVC
jgi:hypothetical protein